MPKKKLQFVTERQKKAAELLAKGDKSIKECMIEAGYSPNVAKLGVAGIPMAVMQLMPKQANLVKLGEIDVELQQKLVRGRLVMNSLRGRDGGTISAKALGSEKRVDMFRPESQVGMIVVNAPPAEGVEKLLQKEEPDASRVE